MGRGRQTNTWIISGDTEPSFWDTLILRWSKRCGGRAPGGHSTGASHELELEWAELIVEMVPCAEKVRFTSSGTEASMLGIRLARAFSGKDKIVRFVTNFHGWHDQVAFASVSHFDGSHPRGHPGGDPSKTSFSAHPTISSS